MSNKGALALLADYGGDSSDDEVPGPRVSTKRLHRDDEDDDCQERKRFEKFPLPSFMVEKTVDQDVGTEDAFMHEGRIRSFPHERGNWATYVYIPFENNEGIQSFLSATKEIVSNDVQLKEIQDLHISLTRTVVLKHHWIEPFISTLKQNLVYFSKFIVMLSSLNIYCNEERTRTFIGLEVKTGIDTLLKIIECLDVCLSEFNLEKFYNNPSFHLSIAWCLGDCVETLSKHLPALNQHLQNVMSQSPHEYWYVYVDHLICKTGNKFFQFYLTYIFVLMLLGGYPEANYNILWLNLKCLMSFCL